MTFQGAKIREQGVTFGILVVKPEVLRNNAKAQEMRQLGTRCFGFIPIILMAQDARGIPTYSGRRDIVTFLSRVPFQAIPWKEYSVH